MKGKSLKAVAVSLIAALLIFIPVIAAPQVAEAATISPKVTYHTQEEIINYYVSKGINFNAAMSYRTTPKKYNTAGALDEKTSKQALANMNYIRFIAGINSNVTLNSEYAEKAQYAAFINDLNGDLDHYPNKPYGVSEAVYKKGYAGSSECSLSGWNNNVNYALIRWMHELFNASKQYPLGHRMHIIDPTLKQTGFGSSNTAGGASAMHTLGNRNYSASEKYVAWPAQQTPIDVWAGATKWSVSSIGSTVDINKVKVKIKNNNDGRVWNISNNNTSNGTIFTQSFGSNVYLMFEPKNLTPKAGEKYNVEITNLGTDILKYTVEFFDINKEVWKFENGIWVCYSNGKVATSKIGLYKNPENTWVYLNKGKQDKSYVGTSSSSENPSKQYFVRNGVWDTSYTGLAKNRLDGKWYYMEKGRHNTAYLGTSSSTENPNKQYFVRNGVWDTSYTGLAYNKSDDTWYYFTNGRYDSTYVGISVSTAVPTGKFPVKNGKWDKNYTGLAYSKSDDTWYYFTNGRYDSTYVGTSVSTAVPTGKFPVKSGKWDKNYTGLVYSKTDNTWYYFSNGRYNTTFEGLSLSTANANSVFYVKNGKWQNTYNGTVKINKVTYNIKSGKVI